MKTNGRLMRFLLRRKRISEAQRAANNKAQGRAQRRPGSPRRERPKP